MYFGALHNSLQAQYFTECSCDYCQSVVVGANNHLPNILELSANKTNKKVFKKVLNTAEKAFKRLYKNKNYKPEDLFEIPEYKALINETTKVFSSAISYEVSDTMRSYLEQDAFVFSALKTHTQLTEARSYLKDEKGNVTPYYKFEQKVLKLNKTYNKQYLQAEYEFAVHSAQSAEKWENFSDNEERYWLQFRTAGDSKVRDSHAELNGTTLPKSDSFWYKYMAPLGWRCRCLVVEVLARKYKKSDSKEAIKKGEAATTEIGKNGKNKLEMFRFNPGKEKKMFPPKNSYTKVVGADRAKKVIKEKAKLWKQNKIYQKPRNEQFKRIEKNVYEHELVNKIDDYKEIKQTAKLLSENGKRTELMPEIYKNETTIRQLVFKHLPKSFNSNPDLRNGNLYYDLKRPKSIRRILKNANKASSQGAIAIISDSNLNKPLTDKIIKNRAKHIFESKEYKPNIIIFKRNNELIIINKRDVN